MPYKKIRRERVACVDTSFVEGDFLKMARDYKQAKTKKDKKYQIKIIPSKRLQDILEAGTTLYITPITKYQILQNLIFSESLSFEEANAIYLSVLNQYKSLVEIKWINEKIFSDAFIHKALSKIKRKIELHDVLNIEIARLAGMPIITSERKIDVWKLIYEKVFSQEEAWKLFRRET